MELNWKILKMSEMDVMTFHDLIQLRIEVFVIEQDCPYQELDGVDPDAWHLIGTSPDGATIACARMIAPGRAYPDYASVGRIIVKQGYRDLGLGHEIVKRSLAFMDTHFPNDNIKISAQEHLEGFYQSHGFRTSGAPYLEDGIPHIPMVFGR